MRYAPIRSPTWLSSAIARASALKLRRHATRNSPGSRARPAATRTSSISAGRHGLRSARNVARSRAGTSSAAENSALTRSQALGGSCSVPRQFAAQPGSRHGPLALDGGERNSGDARGFFEGEAAEVTQLDDLALGGSIFSRLNSAESMARRPRVRRRRLRWPALRPPRARPGCRAGSAARRRRRGAAHRAGARSRPARGA